MTPPVGSGRLRDTEQGPGLIDPCVLRENCRPSTAEETLVVRPTTASVGGLGPVVVEVRQGPCSINWECRREVSSINNEYRGDIHRFGSGCPYPTHRIYGLLFNGT